MTTPILPKRRIEIIDALRGFALAGIVIVHVVENYVGSAIPEKTMDATHLGVLDYVVDGFIALFLRGKFFALFSFLFGLSFFIQMDNARNSGGYFGFRFLWRLLVLLIIGVIHHMFYRGDILTIYAFLGIFLIPFDKVNNKWVLGVSALLFLGLGRYLVFAFTHGANLFGSANIMPDSPEVLTYFNTIKSGSILDVFISNSTEGHVNKMEYQLGVFGRGYITFGFFLVGLVVGRTRLFQKYTEHKKMLKKLLIWSVVLFVVSIGLAAVIFMSLGQEVKFDNWVAMIGLTTVDLNNIALTLIIIALFIMAYRTTKGEKWLGHFAPYGRMALSNYLLQGVLGTFIFFGWGLGYLGAIPNRYAFLLAILIIIIQMLWSKWWLTKFQYGPLEWLWRSITFFKWYPLKRKSPIKS